MHKASMGFFIDPSQKKNEKCFFDLEACQLTVGQEGALERVGYFSRWQKMPIGLI